MANITDAVLAAALKELMADNMIERKSYDEIPPRVEYSLTDTGRSVIPILQKICQRSGIFTKKGAEAPDTLFAQCQKCDYKGKIQVLAD